MRTLQVTFMLALLSVATGAFAYGSSFDIASTVDHPLVLRVEDGVATVNGHFIWGRVREGAIAARASDGFAAWTEADGAVMGVRLGADGSATGTVRRFGSSARGPITIAAAEDRYLIAWAGAFGEVNGAIVGPTGAPMVPAMPLTTQSPSEIGEMRAAASADGFAIAWHFFPEADVAAVTLNAYGVPVSMTPLVISVDGSYEDVTSDGKQFFVAWGNGDFISGRTLSVEGELGPVRRLVDGAAPRIVWDGVAYAMTFIHRIPSPPFESWYALAVLRVTSFGKHLGVIELNSPGSPGEIDARGGRIDIAYFRKGVVVQSISVPAEPRRMRSVRH